MNSSSLFNSAKNYVAKHYGNNPGKMLIHTGVIGWILSSAAQVTAICFNDKIPKEQKMYMIPQEMADAAVNILSFYAITQSFKSIALKLVNTGKWLPSNVRKFLKEGWVKDVGETHFDVLKNVTLPQKFKTDFINFRNGIDIIATTIGSILSCNIVTPIIRNEIAANHQKHGLERMQAKKEDTFTSSNITTKTQNINISDNRNISGVTTVSDTQNISEISGINSTTGQTVNINSQNTAEQTWATTSNISQSNSETRYLFDSFTINTTGVLRTNLPKPSLQTFQNTAYAKYSNPGNLRI